MSRLESYSKFINDYIKYFDTNDVSFEFFKSCSIDKDGKVLITREKFNECEKFVFARAQATINVVGVSLKDITSTNDPTRVTVFSSNNYSIESMSGITYSNITEDFNLEIELTDGSIANADSQEAGLFETLQVQPYLYLSVEEYDVAVGENGTGYDATQKITVSGLWAGYSTVPVYGFDGNNPKLKKTLVSDEISGYLILIEKDSANKDNEFISITRKQNSQDKKLYWEINYNVPLIDNSENISFINKALFLKFSVTGVDLKDNSQFVKSTYSRIYIDYTTYEYKDKDYQVLSMNKLVDKMTINSELRKYSESGVSSDTGYAGNKQEVKVDTSTIENLSSVQYTNVMYFVEKTSNEVLTGNEQQKIVAVGSYTFTALNGNKLTYADAELCGERLPVDDDGKVYLHVLNAANDPVKVFAVVYLSDKQGNPIDLNGKKILLDESGANIVNLYILEQSDITSKMPSIKIDSYVDNVNLYSMVKVEQNLEIPVIESGLDENHQPTDIIKDHELIIPQDTLLKRNAFDSYEIEGLKVSEEGCEKLRDIFKLKLLTNKEYIIYASNFDLRYEGSAIEATTSVDETKEVKLNMFTSGTVTSQTRAFSINTYNNKELALRDMCKNFSANYKLSAGNYVNVSAIYEQVFAEIPQNYIEFRITRYSVDGTNDYFSIVPNKEGVIYSELLTNNSSYNRVNYEVGEFAITDVRIKESEDLSETDMLIGNQNIDVELTTPAADKSLTRGDLKFVTSTRQQYAIKLNNDTKNIDYLTFNNIELEDGTLNRDLVDMSYSDSDLDQYLADCKSTNVVDVKYSVPTSIAEITSDFGLTFTKNNDNKLPVGSKIYDIVGNKFKVDNFEYELTDGKFVYNKGDYFPIVEKNSKKYAVILGNEFEINYNEQTSSYQIISGNDLCSIKILDSGFNNYIKTIDSSAVTKVTKTNQSTGQEETLAYVNFVKGEADRKVVYMIITLTAGTGNNAEQITICRSVQYNLYQGDVSLSALSYNEDYDNTNDETYINSSANPQEFNCGDDNAIVILKKLTNGSITDGVSNKGVIAVDGVSDNFFNHVEYMIENQASGVKLKYKGSLYDSYVYDKEEIQDLILVMPDSDKDISTSIILRYTYKGETKVFKYYILVKANITLEKNDSNLTLLYGNYGYSVNSGATIDLASLFKVTSSGPVTPVLEFEIEDSTYATFEDAQFRPVKKGTLLKVKNCYSLDGKPITNKIILTISIKDSITFTEKLYITINPNLTLIMPQTTPTIYNGDSLIANHIKIYDGLSVSPDDLCAPSTSVYNNINIYLGTYTKASEVSALTPVANGVIDLPYSNVDQTQPITVVYTNVGKQEFVNLDVIVKGIDFIYKSNSINGDISVDLLDGKDFDVTKYITVNDNNVLPMLVDAGDLSKVYTNIPHNLILNGASYLLGYGVQTAGSDPVLIDVTGYSVTINIMKVQYNESGDELGTFIDLTNNVEIKTVGTSNISVSDCFKVDVEDYVVFLFDGSKLYDTLTKENLVDGREFNIVVGYYDDETKVLFDSTEYGLTINIIGVQYNELGTFVDLTKNVEINTDGQSDIVVSDYFKADDGDYVIFLSDGENLYATISKGDLVNGSEFDIVVGYYDDETKVLFGSTEYGLKINIVTP